MLGFIEENRTATAASRAQARARPWPSHCEGAPIAIGAAPAQSGLRKNLPATVSGQVNGDGLRTERFAEGRGLVASRPWGPKRTMASPGPSSRPGRPPLAGPSPASCHGKCQGEPIRHARHLRTKFFSALHPHTVLLSGFGHLPVRTSTSRPCPYPPLPALLCAGS